MFNSINKKFILAFGLTILVLMTLFAFILINVMNKNLIYELEKNLQIQTDNYYKTVELYNDTLEENTYTLLRVFKKSFRKLSLRNDNTTKINGIPVRNIYNGFASLNKDVHPVDLFTQQTGAVSSIYVKDKGEYISVTSSLKLSNGKRNLLDKIKSGTKFDTLENKKDYISLETIGGKNYISAYSPIISKGKIIGALYVGYKFTDGLKSIKKKFNEVKIGQTGYIFVLNSQGILQIHKNLEGKNVSNIKDNEGKFFIKDILKEKNGILHYNYKENNEVRKKIAVFKYYKKWDWIIVLSSYEDEFLDISKKVQNLFLIATIILIVVFLLITVILINKIISKPLSIFENGLLNFFKFVNKKTTDVTNIDISTNDEIGKMATVINKNIKLTKQSFKDDITLISNVKEILQEVNKGYLNKKIESSSSSKILNELKDLINQMLTNLNKFMGDDINNLLAVLDSYAKKDFTQTLDENKSGIIGKEISSMNKMITQMLIDNKSDGIKLNESSEQLSSNVNTLTTNATNQASSLEEVAASITQVTENINNTSQKAQNMYALSSNTKESSNEGKDLANKTVLAMDEINEKVQTINESITIIDQIAFQTNILSLNAAVEAATAGEAGKGFAVVAQEVRNLAARSAEAANEIKQLVESATVQTQEGKKISSEMISGFEELEEKINKTNSMIDDVANAAKEQTEAISHISDTINNLDKFTQQNALVADETNQISKFTQGIAQEVLENVNKNKFKEH